ncbi:MAG: pitrilysin family protein [Arachidicoccus sp.]|nr:pitrilysin family protein [Arachidicoccus sp.]
MRKIIFLCALASVSYYLNAQKPSNIFTTTLQNGLQVTVVEDHSVPLATVEITTKNGSYTEPPEYNGLSHLYEHMFFKANKDYPSQEAFMARVKDLGIEFNGTTSEERVNYFFTLPKTNLDSGLLFMNSAIRYPLFLQDEIKRENVVVDGEFQRNESNPFFALYDSINHEMWGDLYSRKNVIGDHHIINTATPEKMMTIKNKYYWPNNSMLIVSGDVNHDYVFKKVKEIYDSWKSSDFDPFKKWPIPEFKPLTSDKYFVVKSPNAQVPMIMVEWFGPDTRNDKKSTYTADVFSYILSQNSSRWQQNLIDSGYALQVGINYQTQKYVGPITLQIIPNPSKIAECVAKVKAEIAQWDSPDYITDEQLENAKRGLEIQNLSEQDITSSYSHTIAFWWCSSDLDYMYNYISNVKKVTKEDIKNYVDKYILNKHYCAGLLLNSDQAKTIDTNAFWKS